MSKTKLILFLVWVVLMVPYCLLTVFGCGPGSFQTKILKEDRKFSPSYVVGAPNSANVGNVIIWRKSWTELEVERWHGIQNGGWWKETDRDINPFREELVYLGISGDTLRVGYREYSGKYDSNLIRPAFSQELTYDLRSSLIIVFKNFRIKVLGADNEQIEFVVLKD